MTHLFVDGFDHYGTTIANMEDGAWAEVEAGITLTAAGRTGTYCLRFTSSSGSAVRLALAATETVIGFGLAVRLTDGLPSGFLYLAGLQSPLNASQMNIRVTNLGAIEVVIGGSTYTSASQPIVSDSWQHIEYFTTIHDTTGSFELRVDGVTVLSQTGINTDPQAESGVGSTVIGFYGASSVNTRFFNADDYFLYNGSGTVNNTFLGDSRARLILPDSNETPQDWSVTGAASAYEAIDEVPPDDDTSYIAASTPNDESQFGLEDVPVDVVTLYGVMTFSRMKKTDAGSTTAQVSMVSGASEDDGTDHSIAESYTYYKDVFETDPNTGSLWTRAGFNAAEIKVTKTT